MIEFEFKKINPLICFAYGVNPAIACSRFRLDIIAEQSENRKKDILEIAFILMMHIIWNPGEEDFQRLVKLVNLAVEGIEPQQVTELGKDIAMQICAMNPSYLDKSDVSQEVLNETLTSRFGKSSRNHGMLNLLSRDLIVR